MSFPRLYAKSRPSNLPESAKAPSSLFLPGHLQDVYHAARRVFDCTADEQLQSLGLLADEQQMARFRRILLLAAAVHDLGKANDHFQGLLQKTPERRGRKQGLRHEWMTLMMLDARYELRSWLLPAVENDEGDWRVVLWAVSGHHPAHDRPSPPLSAEQGAGNTTTMLTGHHDYAACLEWLTETFGLVAAPTCRDIELKLAGSGSVFKRLFDFHRESNGVWKQLDDEQRRFVAAVKDCLIAADVAGSALPRSVKDAGQRADWIPAVFQRKPTVEQLNHLIHARLTDKNGRTFELRPFQREVAERASRVTLVKAGCGTGKTLGAYHWNRTYCPGKRLYICYPTTGTATEGFRDYLVQENESRFGADLFHGRALVDKDIFQVLEGGRDESEAVARIESLDAWSTPIVSCTVDTVLGIVQNNRRGLFSWPALAGAAFVFDEIHAYDNRLFGALLRFLDAMRGVPVLLMTASLSEHRRKAIVQCLGRFGELLTEIPGPADLEKLPRYHRQGDVDPRDPLPEVREVIDRGGKVLWVSNTVDRVIAAAERATALKPIVYHSRFRYEDRVQRHGEVIDAFRVEGPGLAVCSQVAEMSLDLSADLLVTDLAPVPSLIQRLGRLNRRAKEGDPTRPFIVIEPLREDGQTAALPYEADDLEAARQWLAFLPALDISQADLACAWEIFQQTTEAPILFVSSAWLDGGPKTEVRELRDASPGVTVIMETDFPQLAEGTVRVAQVALPMPPPPPEIRREMNAWADFQGIPVSPSFSISYDLQRGAQWRKKNQQPRASPAPLII